MALSLTPYKVVNQETSDAAKFDNALQAIEDYVNGLVTAQDINAKGDLLVGSGDNQVIRIPAGSDGQILIVDSSVPGGLRWGAAPSGGGGGGTPNPPGAILLFGGGTAPVGYLLCNGASVSQATYADLFAAIGTTYGTSGAGTFNLPNLKGRTVIGQDAAQAEFDALGEVGGSKSTNLAHSHGVSALAHSHGFNVNVPVSVSVGVSGGVSVYTTGAATGSENNNHSHSYANNGGSASQTSGTDANHQHGYTAPTGGGDFSGGGSGSGNGTAAGSTDSQLSSASTDAQLGAVSLLTPYIVMNYIIKT